MVALLCTDAARWLSGHTVMADGAASFAARWNLIGTTAKLPMDEQRRQAGLGPAVPASDPPGTAPSVPDL